MFYGEEAISQADHSDTQKSESSVSDRTSQDFENQFQITPTSFSGGPTGKAKRWSKGREIKQTF